MSSIIRATTTSGLQVAPDNSGSLQLQTNGTTAAVTIDTSQNVGIGTTSPVTRLDVVGGSSSIRGAALFNTSSTAGTGSSAYIRSANAYSAATTPDYTWWYNDQCGLFHPAADVIGFSTTGTERMRIDSSGYTTNIVNGGGTGLIQSQLYYRLNTANAGANATGAQSIFGVGVPLLASTQYEFEIFVVLSKSAGTTSHAIGIGFGGTATVNNILYQAYGNYITSATPSGLLVTPAGSGSVGNSTANTSIFPATTTAAWSPVFIIKGTVSINAAGTFIPQYTLSAAPGGAFTTQIGSYIKISPLAASGANVNIGSWA